MSIVQCSYTWECSICHKKMTEEYQMYSTSTPLLPTIPIGWDIIFDRVICDEHKFIVLRVGEQEIWLRSPL